MPTRAGYQPYTAPFDPYAGARARAQAAQPVHPAVTAARAQQAVSQGMHPAAAQQWALQGGQPAQVARPNGDLYSGGVRWSSGANNPVQATAELYARQFEAIFGLSHAKVEVVGQTSWGPGTPAELVDVPGPVESMRIAANTELWRLPTIVAHEYGHAMQIAAGYDPGEVHRELDATRIAGRFLRLSGNSLDTALADLGSFAGSAVHGTREQQIAALLQGYNEPEGAWFQPYRGLQLQADAPAFRPQTDGPFSRPLDPLSKSEKNSLSWQLGLKTWGALQKAQIDTSAALAAGTLDGAGQAKLKGDLEAVKAGLAALSERFGDGERLFWLDGAHGELKLPFTLGRLKADVATLENLIAGKTLDLDVSGFRFTDMKDQERGNFWLKQRNVVFHFERPGKGGERELLEVRVHSVRHAPGAVLSDGSLIETPEELKQQRTAVPLPSASVGKGGEAPDLTTPRLALTPAQIQALFGGENAALFADKVTAQRADIILRNFGAEA